MSSKSPPTEPPNSPPAKPPASSREKNTPPTSYDVLASVTKYEVGTFDDFCSEYGYDTDSRKALKTYKAVLREWKNIEKLFTAEQIEELQEIN